MLEFIGLCALLFVAYKVLPDLIGFIVKMILGFIIIVVVVVALVVVIVVVVLVAVVAVVAVVVLFFTTSVTRRVRTWSTYCN